MNRSVQGIVFSGALLAAQACAQGQTSTRVDSSRVLTDSMKGAGGRYTTTRSRALSDSIVRLSPSDSIEWQSFGALKITGRPEGLLVTYHPFFDLADTARVRRVALLLFDSLRTKFDNGEPPYIVLRAVNLRARDRNQPSAPALHAFGVVLEKHGDGHWYVLQGAAPIRP